MSRKEDETLAEWMRRHPLPRIKTSARTKTAWALGLALLALLCVVGSLALNALGVPLDNGYYEDGRERESVTHTVIWVLALLFALRVGLWINSGLPIVKWFCEPHVLLDVWMLGLLTYTALAVVCTAAGGMSRYDNNWAASVLFLIALAASAYGCSRLYFHRKRIEWARVAHLERKKSD